MTDEEEEIFNRRLINMSPVDAVLLLFNESNDSNFNRPDVDISLPVAGEDQEKCRVTLKGKAYRGLSGNPSAVGTAGFTYHRVNLAEVGIPNNGRFFDYLPGAPSFLAAITEFTRRTQFNCSHEDFDELAFYPDINGNRRLKASELSHRFYGEVNLGRPYRDDLGQSIQQQISVNLKSYHNAFFLNANRLLVNLDVGHRYDIYSNLSVGYVATDPNHLGVGFILQHMERKGIEAGFSSTPIAGVNLYGARITYKGRLRDGDDQYALDRNRVIVFELAGKQGYWNGGELRFFYPSERISSPRQTPSVVTVFNLTEPKLVTGNLLSVMPSLVVGKKLNELSVRDNDEIFNWLLGVSYNPDDHGEFKVTYNGGHRCKDQLPSGVDYCNVVEITPPVERTSPLSGPIKLHYR